MTPSSRTKKIPVTCDPHGHLERRPLAELTPFQGGLKDLDDARYAKLKASILAEGFMAPVFVWKDLILDGHQRTTVLEREGWDVEGDVPVVEIEADDEADAARKLLKLTSAYGKPQPEGVFDFMQTHDLDLGDFADVDLPEFDQGALEELFGEGTGDPYDLNTSTGALAERFGVVPFSVLDERQGYWQQRKAAWMALGIQSELGRGENLLNFSEQVKLKKRAALSPGGGGPGKSSVWMGKEDATSVGGNGRLTYTTGKERRDPVSKMFVESAPSGTSIFDPVLCELAYRWFCPPGGMVLDPFAGGSVRGFVAAWTGRNYSGIDLSEGQLAANRVQWEENVTQHGASKDRPAPKWTVGDSSKVLLESDEPVDFVFSCPPYADLEKYSDDERDLSTMSYDDFLEAYRAIIAAACARLREDRFACFVVGDLRAGKHGAYRGFVCDTVAAFRDAGLIFYNDAVLVTMVGSLALRVGRQFSGYRKLGKTHQNVLVFCKGDPGAATEAVGDVEFGEVDEGGVVPDMEGVGEL